MIKIKLWSAPTSMRVPEQTVYKDFLSRKIEIASLFYPELGIQNDNLNIIAQGMFRSKHEAISAMQGFQRIINEELI